jgi:hypothetical protein
MTVLTIANIMFLLNRQYSVDNFPKSSKNISRKLGNLRIALLMAKHINNEKLIIQVQEAFDKAIKELKDLLDKTPFFVTEQMGHELLERSIQLNASGDRNYPPLMNISRHIGKAIIAMECFILLKDKSQSTVSAFEMIKKGDKKVESFIKTFEASTIKKNMLDF